MARTATGIDVGSRTTTVLRGQYKGNTFHASDFAVSSHQADDAVSGWDDLQLPFKPRGARVGVTGREFNIRFVRVPRVPDWQLRNLMKFEVAEIGDTSGSEVAYDFNLLPELPEIDGEDIALLCMAKESLLDGHMEGLAAVGGSLDAFAPSSIGLYNAWMRYGVLVDDTVLVANIGHDTIDLVLTRGPDLVFARNLTGGASLFDQAIAQRFNVSAKQAEELKQELATLRPGASYATPNHEKASRAILGAAGQILSLLQSSVLFAKSQVKIPSLKLDRVMLCGGGAALDGLCEYLTQAMGVKVELFDPFRVVDTSKLSPEQVDLLDDYKLESVVALGLATMASDPEGYSLEILPAAVAKRRAFMGGTLWSIVAGILAVIYLGLYARAESEALETVRVRSGLVASRLSRVNRTHSQTQELVDTNERLEQLAGELTRVAGTGEQLARTLEFLDKKMPADFWIDRLTTGLVSDSELGIPKGEEWPVLTLKGKTRKGVSSAAVLWGQFTADLEAAIPEATINPSLDPTGDGFTLDLTLFSKRQDPGEPGESGEAGADEES